MASFGATLGSTNGDRTANVNTAFNAVVTTSVASGTNRRIVVAISYWTQDGSADGPTSVTDSQGSYTRDAQFPGAGAAPDVVEFWSRPVGGTQLASGSTITAAFPAQGATKVLGGYFVAAHTAIVTDLTNGGGVDIVGTGTTSGTPWSVGVTATTAGIAFAVVGTEVAAASTNTPSSGTEIYDQRQTTSQQGMVNQYLVVTGAGTVTLSGTLSTTSTVTTMAVVVYKDTAATPTPQRILSIPSPAVTRAATR